MAPAATKTAPKNQKLVFKVDYSKPVGDSIFDSQDYLRYLQERIKVDGKPGQLGDAITLKAEATKLTLTSTIPFSKRSLKYITKKYLAKTVGAGFMRVVATSKDTYTISYRNVAEPEEAEEADEE